MVNRLASQTSPYLLQHAQNPVDWYPWGEEAFEAARAQDKPIFLSVGYSACHWCHVMERESFEDEQTAALLNEHFISIKVDREERPDVDAIYMATVQAMTGGGGWPMSVFLTPDAAPFWGGTYFPNESRHGMPSFSQVLGHIVDLWQNRRDEVLSVGSSLTEALREQQASGAEGVGTPPGTEVLDAAVRELSDAFDAEHGGWGEAPKFPQPPLVELLLRRHHATGDESALAMATATLDAMMRGGIYDQLGGGFHRYSTDAAWLVPHFEKMLYDNAQLARVYLHAWQVTGDDSYRRVVTRTLDYVAREMLDPQGGFYSAQDADSEGEEGRFFVWTAEQIAAALAAAPAADAGDAELFSAAYGVTERGNFEGKNILFVARTAEQIGLAAGMSTADVEAALERSRVALFAAREQRVRPARDDKILAGWNGLMLAAFAEAARVLERDDYREIAERNAEFLLASMRDARGRMLRTWGSGRGSLNGYLEDYANLADGLLELYQTTFDDSWFDAARSAADAILAHFSDPDGGFFDTSDDHETLLVRPKGLQDGATPSGGSVAAGALLRLSRLTGDARYAVAAESALGQLRCALEQVPLGFACWLSVLDAMIESPAELAIVGDDLEPLLRVARSGYHPNLVVAAGSAGHDGGVALLENRDAVDGKTAAYVCSHFACEQPVTTPEELEALLER